MEYKNKDGTPSPSHIVSGKIGEAVAADYLMTHGYKIVCRNYRFHRDEIDIIASDGQYIVFVEVKTRHEFQSSKYGRPSRAVNYGKRRNLVNAAKAFIRNLKIVSPCRFDVIEVYVNDDTVTGKQSYKVAHLKGVFGAGGKIGF